MVSSKSEQMRNHNTFPCEVECIDDDGGQYSFLTKGKRYIAIGRDNQYSDLLVLEKDNFGEMGSHYDTRFILCDEADDVPIEVSTTNDKSDSRSVNIAPSDEVVPAFDFECYYGLIK